MSLIVECTPELAKETRANMLWTILLFSSIAAQAVQVPLAINGKEVDLTPVTYLASPPDGITEEQTSTTSIEEDKWKCDIRSWVRAPDLDPSSIIPAETRLAANGSECSDRLKWEVGLRFKERAIIKLNGGVYSPADDDCHTQLEAYNEAIKNQSLWEVHGSERIVFDIKQSLSLNPANTSHIDEVQSFVVETPNTNFPPVDDKAFRGLIILGSDEHILNTEKMMEYYHSIHLKNGTVLDIPAGRTGFIPQVQPDSITRASEKPNPWPEEVKLESPRLPLGSNETFDRSGYPSVSPYNPEGPDCDRGNRAEFVLEVNSNITEVVQGQCISLDITVTRTGNGSEYPAYLQMEMQTKRNITWAYNFLSTEEEYNTIFSPSSDRRSQLSSFTTHQPPIQMLKKPSQRRLEAIREREGMISSSWSSNPNRQQLQGGQVRYDIEEEHEEGLEVYKFQISVPVLDELFPSFETTFESFQSVLQFQLMTMFTCEPRDIYPRSASLPKKDETVIDDDAKLTMERDEKWVEYRLPPKNDKKKLRNGRRLNHIGSIPLEITLKPSNNTKDIALSSYLDENALGPIIRLPDSSDKPEFSKLGIPQEEPEDLLKRTRYSRGYYGGRGNTGGGMLHAARLWESKEKDISE